MTTEKSGPTVNTTENPSSSSDTANQEFLVLTYVSVYSDNYGLALIILNIGHRSSFAKKSSLSTQSNALDIPIKIILEINFVISSYFPLLIKSNRACLILLPNSLKPSCFQI